jgi:Glycoside hydrolase 123, N-terminal domain
MKLILSFLFIFLSNYGMSNRQKDPGYSVPESLWPESFGNHRAVLEIPRATQVAILDILWRRHDQDPQKKRFIIVEASTGDTIENILRYSVTNERCRLAFGPVKRAGTYYFYYLPYEVQKEWGFYGKDYLKPEKSPSGKWVNLNKAGDMSKLKSFTLAKLTGFQSRTAFDSFYPMEIIPLSSEKKSLLTKFPGDYLIFPEDRKFPVRMKDEIPLKWVERGPSGKFSGEALRNEYYAFQIGVYASKKELLNVKVELSSLANSSYNIPASALTCFNTGGTGPYGNSFEKRVDVPKGAVQPLWIGIDIPENIPAGNYTGRIIIRPENADPQALDINLKILKNILADRGDSEPWRHSRLRWLNSTLGIDDMPTKPYDAIEFMGNNVYRLTDKKLTMDPGGMPGSIKVSGTEILARPLSFVVETKSGTEQFSLPEDVALLKNEPGAMSGSWKSHSGNILLNGVGIIESDGYINYKVSLTALRDLNIKDIRLELPFSENIAEYMIGMGLPGTIVPKEHQSGWKGPHDSFWIGNTSAGIWCELRGSAYHGPLLNLYHPAFPSSWYNEGKGGFSIKKDPKEVKAVAYSGEREMKSGEKVEFEWSLLITPVKKINYKSQFSDRYYHNGEKPMPPDSDLACGVKIVNLHHANNYNPHINYPFIAVDSMKWFVNRMHSKGQKVKIYYTIRELTNYTTELWALRSLGDEILGNGKCGGFPWLREHLIEGYNPQWYQHFEDKSADASILSAPGDSRWYNYYIEGLAWLVRNVDIDGLYLDDVTYDRRTVKRIRKVLDNEKPGCLLDLHSNTGFSKGPANQYAEFFPFVDKLWFGESFQYDNMPPENWLVEVSGIPFGLMGDMLQGGGNRWLGMVYGMTVRHPWLTEGVRCDPRPVWKIWDEFGIESSVMKGYWEKDCPVKTDRADIKITIYQKDGESLISVGSWAEERATFSLHFDWKALGLDSTKAALIAPYIKDFQEEKTFKPDEPIPVDPKKGWLFFLRDVKK